jgi:hypothetical protein
LPPNTPPCTLTCIYNKCIIVCPHAVAHFLCAPAAPAAPRVPRLGAGSL